VVTESFAALPGKCYPKGRSEIYNSTENRDDPYWEAEVHNFMELQETGKLSSPLDLTLRILRLPTISR
jgi:hypothetical protein